MTISILTAFTAGILSFFSPCIIPLIPVYVTYLFTLNNNKWLNILMFILGFTTVFISFGIISSLFGSTLGNYREYIVKIGAIIIILMGLLMLDIGPAFLKANLIPVGGNKTEVKGPFLLGVILSISWTPCIGPVLASILILAATTKTLYEAIIYLLVYSLGLTIPFVITAILINRIKSIIKIISKYSRYIEIISGIMLILFGLLIFFDKINIIY
ncbi:cytochrome c biogenesis CcdA family protein [Caldicellulosiruptoraceae bacterium PP1]